jgi:replication factor A1
MVCMKLGCQFTNSLASTTQPANVGAVFPITSLTPYQNKFVSHLWEFSFAAYYACRWQIRARVTTKTPIKEWNKAGNTGKLFSMDLTDESGEIRATAFKAECDKYYSLMHVGKVRIFY